MNVMQRWVWPSLKFLVFAVIAVALVRLAFFAAGPSAPETRPTGKVDDPTVTVTTGDVVNDVQAEGAIRSVASTPVRAIAEGAVNKVYVTNGAHVEPGAPIVDLRIETAPAETPASTTQSDVTEDGAPSAAAPPAPVVTYATVVADAAGTVSGLDLVAKQPVAIGDVVARVAPESYRATAVLGAAQLYRLGERPTEATVTIVDGPAPFTCSNLSLTSADTEDAPAPEADVADTGADGGTRLECDVPANVTVFPGLAATIAVPAGRAEGVLTLPTTAVQGSAEKGVVTVVGDGGSRREQEVVLGLNDGQTVEVKSGLSEGDSVLEFVPGAEADVDTEGGDVGGGDVEGDEVEVTG